MRRTQAAKTTEHQTVGTHEPALRLVAPPAPTATLRWKRAGFLRLFLAEVIDRLLPLPFLAFFFPQWTLFVLAYHVLCDCSPHRRSAGKWLFRLRVVQVNHATTCAWWRAALQRLGIALAQAAWSLWLGIPYLLAYELGALAFVWLSPTGQRPEEYAAGTLVVTERSFRRRRQEEVK